MVYLKNKNELIPLKEVKRIFKNGWKDSIQQAAKGRKGRTKNKGFKWYHDGTKSLQNIPSKQQKRIAI